MAAHLDFKRANAEYVAAFGEKGLGDLPLPPAKKLAIVTCMDARLNPYAHLGLKEGEAHIIRNAGGVAKEALRSIIISQRFLGTREVAVFHHTGCGMLGFTTPQARTLLKGTVESSHHDLIDHTDFLEFADLEESVRADVKFVQEHPLVLPETKVTGWVYEVETGQVRQIV
ncbi:carbonic anhydrase [Amylocystis lapponica]|nr:carbonic anhydrase [Amylocystis lapponica]